MDFQTLFPCSDKPSPRLLTDCSTFPTISSSYWGHQASYIEPTREQSQSERTYNEPDMLLCRSVSVCCWDLNLNVGNWIARIQPREFTLRASGWVRMVSGIQSLISVYLLALSVLSYFGRPFDQFWWSFESHLGALYWKIRCRFAVVLIAGTR